MIPTLLTERPESATSAPSVLTNLDPALRTWWHPVALASEVTDAPVAVMLFGERYVIVRLGGTLTAFADRCPHRLAPLSAGTVVGAELQCGYHGWRFRADGHCAAIPTLGESATIPPRAQLDALRVEEQHGLVFLAVEPPTAPRLAVPEWGDERFAVAWLPVLDAAISAGQFVDNFLDVAHFPFVHAGTFGAAELPTVGEIEVAREGWTFVSRYDHMINNSEDPKVATGEHSLLQPRRTEYTYAAPFAVRLRLELPVAESVNVICLWVQPLSAQTSRIYCALVRNDITSDEVGQGFVDYELAVVAEDLRTLGRIEPKALAIDPTIEVHTRVDRTTVELRRVLRDLVQLADARS